MRVLLAALVAIGAGVLASPVLAHPQGITAHAAATRTATVSALPSPLPAGWVIFDSNRCPLPATTCTTTQNWEVYARDTSGNVYQVTSNLSYDSWWPKLSPDRTRILFIRTDAGEKEQDWTKNSLWDVPVDASAGPKLLVPSENGIAAGTNWNWIFQGHEEWAPNGNQIVTIATTAGRSLQIYVMNFDKVTNSITGLPYPVSHGASASVDRPGTNIDPSWNPDGNSILFIGCALNVARTQCALDGTPPDTTRGGYKELILTANSSSGVLEYQRSLTTDGTQNYDPYFAPNSTQIAWLHEDNCNTWAIRHSNVVGGSLSTVIDDGAVNSKPAWSADSSTIFFHRYGSVAQSLWSIPAAGGSATQLGLGSNTAIYCSGDHPSNTSGSPSTPLGPAPTVPTTSVVFASNRCPSPPCSPDNGTGNWGIYQRDSSGTVTPLFYSTSVDSFDPQVSPDRSSILFMYAPKGETRDSRFFTLAIIKANGTTYAHFPAMTTGTTPFYWTRFNHPTWSVDGHAIVFDASTAAQEAKGPGPDENNQIYFVAYNGDGSVGITVAQETWGPSGAGDRPGNNVMPSWNPDGASILFIGCTPNAGRTACDGVHSNGDIQLISSLTHTVDVTRTSTADGTSYSYPVESPNGTYITAAHQLTCTSSSIVRLASTGGAVTTLINDGSQYNRPTWSTTSSTIYFDKLPATVGPNIWSIIPHAPSPPGPNGTGLTQITGLAGSQSPCASEFPNLGY